LETAARHLFWKDSAKEKHRCWLECAVEDGTLVVYSIFNNGEAIITAYSDASKTNVIAEKTLSGLTAQSACAA